MMVAISSPRRTLANHFPLAFALGLAGCGSSTVYSDSGTTDAQSAADGSLSADAAPSPDGTIAPGTDAAITPDAMANAPDTVVITPGTDAAITPDAVVIAPGSDASTSTACTTVPRTCAQITAAFAASTAGVVVSCDAAAGTFTFHSTGVPNYTSNQTTPNSIADQGWIVRLPLQPACSATTSDVVNSRGEIGFMINGVPFYGPQDADGHDAVQLEGVSFDDCEGHADPGCSYHYHEEGTCVFGVHDTAAQHVEASGHSALVGFALDGFGVYASESSGETLDACNGHSDATHGYHYHATRTSPYLLGCYRGVKSGVVMRTMNLCNGTGHLTTDAGTGTGTADAMAAADTGAMTGPRACTQTSECTGACPAGSAGCVCATIRTGMGCVPSCSMTSDCPAMVPMCDTTMHVCRPAM